MNRRKYLSSFAVSVGAVMAGCFDMSDEEIDEGQKEEYPTLDKRVDEPPYEIEVPNPQGDPPYDEHQWDSHYLGENMSESPSVSFNEYGRAPIIESKVSIQEQSMNNEYTAHVITSEDEKSEILDTDIFEETVDFAREFLIVVESGYGSSTPTHQWKRVESYDGGVHLHGYYTDPYLQTTDYASRASVVKVRQSIDSESKAMVSLTVTDSHRVHFESTEGVVGVETFD